MPNQTRALAASLWMIGSIIGFSLVAIAGRALSAELDTFEIMLWRSIVGVVTVGSLALAAGRTAELAPNLLGTHFLRNILHFAGQNLWLYALTLIPLSQLFALEFSYPILVALTAPLFLAERLTRTRLMSVFIGFAGILMVAQPFGAAGLSPGLLAALLCAIGFAGAAIVTKRLTRVTTITAILFWLTVMQTGFGLMTAGFDGKIAIPSLALVPWVLGIGLGGLGAHFSLTKALSLAPASIVTPIDFLRLPLITLIGIFFYAEPLNVWVLVGGAVIFCANLINIKSEVRQSPQAMA